MRMDLSSKPKQEKAFTPALTEQIINALCHCKHGVIKMSETIEGVVETSTNLASIKRVDDNLIITTSQRSSFEDQLNALAFETYTLLTECGATAGIHGAYPAWEPKFDTPLLKTAQDAYQQVLGRAPKVKIIHAGLECGLFSKAMPSLSIISFGPTLLGVHSPDERLNIASTNVMSHYLMHLLEKLS
jgi:dipeptidase D